MANKDAEPPYSPPTVHLDADPDDRDWLRIVAADRRRQQYPQRAHGELVADGVPEATDVDRVAAFALSLNGYGLVGRWQLQDEVHGAYRAWTETGHLPQDLTRLRAYLYSEEQDRWVGGTRDSADPVTDPRWPFTAALLEAIRGTLA